MKQMDEEKKMNEQSKLDFEPRNHSCLSQSMSNDETPPVSKESGSASHSVVIRGIPVKFP